MTGQARQSAITDPEANTSPLLQDGRANNQSNSSMTSSDASPEPLPAEWTLVHFLTKRVAKDRITYGDGYGTWYRQKQGADGMEHQYAFGGVNEGPQYYIRCSVGCTSPRDIRRIFIRWHKHCRSSGCACDLNRLCGPDPHKIAFFQFYNVRNDEPVRFKPNEEAMCSRGCVRVEIRSHWHAYRCDHRCTCSKENAKAEHKASRLIEMPLCYVPEPSREELERKYPHDKKAKMNNRWAAYGVANTLYPGTPGARSPTASGTTTPQLTNALKLSVANESPQPSEGGTSSVTFTNPVAVAVDIDNEITPAPAKI